MRDNNKNPYDASQGGTRAMIKTVVVSRPAKSGPYAISKPIILKINKQQIWFY